MYNSDNSSTMKGYSIKALLPSKPGEPGPMEVKAVDYDVLLTAETHNFPTGICCTFHTLFASHSRHRCADTLFFARCCTVPWRRDRNRRPHSRHSRHRYAAAIFYFVFCHHTSAFLTLFAFRYRFDSCFDFDCPLHETTDKVAGRWWWPARRGTVWATSTSRTTRWRGRTSTRTGSTRPSSPARSRSSSRPPTAPATTATSSASPSSPASPAPSACASPTASAANS